MQCRFAWELTTEHSPTNSKNVCTYIPQCHSLCLFHYGCR